VTDGSDFWFWVLVLGVGVLGGLRLSMRWLHVARLVEDTPRSRVRSAAQGYVELAGAALMPDGVSTVAPLTGRPSVWWSYRIEQRVTGESGGRRRERWRTLQSARSGVPFVLEDETGRCLVKPDGAEVLVGESTTWYGDAPWPTGVPGQTAWRHQGRSFRYHEQRIYPHERVYALGAFTTLGSGAAADDGTAVAGLLAEWKRDQAALAGRFDADRDGRVSLAEWEAARAQAQRDVEERRRTRPAEPALNLLARPEDGRLFLIASVPQAELARRYRRRAMLAFLGFLAACYALAWLVR